MTKRKKKNALSLISLLLVLVILIGVELWYSNWKKNSVNSGEEQTTDNLALSAIDTANLSSLHYIAQDADLTLVLEDGVWKSEKDPKRPIKQDNVTSMVNLIGEIKADRLVSENPEDLGEYGLSEPTATLQATQKDGTSLTLQIGKEAIGGIGYYARINEDNKVYLLNSKYATGLKYSDTDMTNIEAGPIITAQNIRHIEIDNRDTADFELLFSQGNELDYSGTGMYPWVLLKPYEEGYTVDLTKVNDVLPNYSSFNFTSCVNYDSKDLSSYGLADPLASIYVQYYETNTKTLPKPEVDPTTGKQITGKSVNEDKDFKIYVGNMDEAGDYFVKTEGSNAVYTMSSATVNKMLQVNAFNLLNTFVAIPNIDSVDKINIEIEGKLYTMEIKRTAGKNAKGEEVTSAAYYYNGNATDEDTFKTVYKSMTAANYDSEIKADVTAGGQQPFMTISYHIFGKNKTITASYLPYDDSFYLVDTGNAIRFFADKRKIDDIAGTIKEFKTPTK